MMENDEFHKLVLQGFKEMNENFKNIDRNFKEMKGKLLEHDQQFIELKDLSNQHHEELEKVARQVENLVVGQETLQDDMDYLLRRTLRKKS